MIVVSKTNTFPVRFSNIFVNYPSRQMKVGDKLWTNWNKAPITINQTISEKLFDFGQWIFAKKPHDLNNLELFSYTIAFGSYLINRFVILLFLK